MKKLMVRYAGWGEDWLLGTLADDGQHLLFEYSTEALAQHLELSPRHLKLRPAAYGDFPPFLFRLPGLIADALPDGWGLLLMDRLFRQRQLSPGPLDRLAFIGDRAMGALRFAPPEGGELPFVDLELLALAREAQHVLSGEASAALPALAVAGGSPQGARPKALVQYDPATQSLSTLPDAPGSPWLMKFQAQGEHKEVCAIEHLYAELAQASGLEVPHTAYFDLSDKLACFGIARFDREGALRVPVHSLAGLLHADFRLPGIDYTIFLRATRLITRDEREVQKAFARAVFNVVFHNRDDHAKNFAWRLGRDRRWWLAPAFDLTFSEGPNGQHFCDVCGEGTLVRRTHLLMLASQGGIHDSVANTTIDHIVEQAREFRDRAQNYPIRQKTIQSMEAAINLCSAAAAATV